MDLTGRTVDRRTTQVVSSDPVTLTLSLVWRAK